MAAEYGVTSDETFLETPRAQEDAVRDYHRKVWSYLLNYGTDDFVGQYYQEVFITESGILAAAHLVGAVDLDEAMRANEVISDALGTKADSYMREMAGYDISDIQ